MKKCAIFKDIFPRLSGTKVIFHDFPGGMEALLVTSPFHCHSFVSVTLRLHCSTITKVIL